MKRLILAAVGVLSTIVGASAAKSVEIEQSHYPEFSWDTLPVAIHLCKSEDDFTQDEVDFMARFPLVCIEKHQAYDKYNDVREGARVAAKAIKGVNPATKVLFYWNSRIDTGFRYFGQNTLGDDQHPEWALKDLKGEYVLARGKHKTYDASNAEFRKWWISVPVDVVTNCENLDGVFIDAMPQHLRDKALTEQTWGVEKVKGVREGTGLMLKGLNEQLGDDKIIVANNIHAISDFETGIHQHIDGGMIEHFCDLDTYTLEFMASQIEIVQDAARRGRITMVKCWPRYFFMASGKYRGIPHEQMIQDTKDDIDFPLACFLIAAGKYSYFLYSWGYFEDQGGMVDYPEFNKRLGEPKGEAKRDGWKYTRKFKYADVTMDLETRTSKIVWK